VKKGLKHFRRTSTAEEERKEAEEKEEEDGGFDKSAIATEQRLNNEMRSLTTGQQQSYQPTV